MTQTLPVRPRKARSYLLHLLLFIPALAATGYGLYEWWNVAPGGTVTAVKLTTKTGAVGQAAEAVANIEPGNPDLFLKVTAEGATLELPARKDTPIGNGLTWELPRAFELGHVHRVEVWDYNSMWKNKQVDNITLVGWHTDGQKYHVELIGKPYQPPHWAQPMTWAGAGVSFVLFMKFLWDQVV